MVGLIQQVCLVDKKMEKVNSIIYLYFISNNIFFFVWLFQILTTFKLMNFIKGKETQDHLVT